MRIARGISVTNTSRPVGITYDADALAFFTAASITDTTQKSAVNTLVLSLKSANIWTKMKAVYPVVGGVASSHAVNLKQPGTFNLLFATGWTHSSTGMTPNGATYADTLLIPLTNLTLNNTHISYYSRTNITATQVECGCDDGINQILLAANYQGVGSFSDQYNVSSRVSTAQTNSQGLFLGTRTSSAVHKLFKNGSQIGTTNTNAGGSLINFKLVLAATNASNIVGIWSTKQCAFASIGDGLTDAEALSFYNAVQTYQTTLGRQV